jgi:hypothetical protein
MKMSEPRSPTASAQACKKLSPQQRAIQKKRDQWREWRASGKSFTNDFDPDTFNWEEYGEHFDELSDEEWAAVWKHVVAPRAEKTLPDEANIRDLVNDAAYSSGWFVGHRELHISRADYRRFADEKRRFLKKAQQFRQEMIEFLGEPPSDHKEPYDPWDFCRPVIPVLDDLAAVLDHRIAQDEEAAAFMQNKDPPNAAKPELDQWRARLVLAWQDGCGIPIENTNHLRGFLLNALRPYMPRAELTDRMAKHFIKRWRAGEVKNPGTSLLQRLKRDKLPTS